MIRCMYCWPCLSLYPQVFSSHSHGSVIIFFPGGGGSEDFGVITWFSGGKEGNRSPTDGGGLDKIECQLTANERVIHKSTEPHRESGKIYCDANNILLKPPPPTS